MGGIPQPLEHAHLAAVVNCSREQARSYNGFKIREEGDFSNCPAVIPRAAAWVYGGAIAAIPCP